jgi:hypothetical protein
MPSASETYTFYFKICYTERTFNLSFTPDTTIKDFIDIVNVYMGEYQEIHNKIEIIQVGQPEGEEAPKINYHEDYTLRDIYSLKWRNTAFYIRIIMNG